MKSSGSPSVLPFQFFPHDGLVTWEANWFLFAESRFSQTNYIQLSTQVRSSTQLYTASSCASNCRIKAQRTSESFSSDGQVVKAIFSVQICPPPKWTICNMQLTFWQCSIRYSGMRTQILYTLHAQKQSVNAFLGAKGLLAAQCCLWLADKSLWCEQVTTTYIL